MKANLSKIITYGTITILIALAISTTAAAQSGNQPPLPVKVTNTDPIPVSGTVTVNSSSSTPLTVTGNVNVAGGVTVTNATNTALNVRDLNSVKKTPIRLQGSCFSGDVTTNQCARIINYVVPDGKILVIEMVSYKYGGPTGSRGKLTVQTCMLDFSCFSGGGPAPEIDRRDEYYLDPTGTEMNWSGLGYAGTSQKVLIFGNDHGTVTMYGQCSPGPTCFDNFRMEVTVSGYLIDK